MAKYFIKGHEVTREEAMARWHRSLTYQNAAHREIIFRNAEIGFEDTGAHNHLREAGISIEPDSAPASHSREGK